MGASRSPTRRWWKPLSKPSAKITGEAYGGASQVGITPAGQTGDGSAGRVAVRLAGGQSMRLDSGSRVRFTTSSAVVLERGAVYVDSAGSDNIEVRTASRHWWNRFQR